MIRFLILAFLLCSFGNSWGQEHYVRFIDIGEMPQYASQFIYDDGYFYIMAASRCIDQDTFNCGGLIKVNDQGEILNTFLKRDFSGNPDALVVSRNNLFLSGEINMGQADSFVSFNLDSSNLVVLDFIEIKNQDSSFYNYNVTSSIAIDEQLIVVGNSFNKKESSTKVGHLFLVNDNHIDTSLVFELSSRSTGITHMKKLSNNDIILYLYERNPGGINDSTIVARIDKSLNIEVIRKFNYTGTFIPRGCVTQDDNILVTVPRVGHHGIRDIWSIDTTGHINWIYEWPSYKGRRNIIRVEQARNGDIFVMGDDWNPELLEDVRHVAFIMRLTPNGNEIWRKYFKVENDFSLLSNYIVDVEEMANGDLQLTGQSRRMIYDETIQDYRPDQDIFWARIGGDGCINGDCGDTYLITSTEEIISESAEGIIEIFPNPVTGNSFTVLSKVSGRLYLYDMQGALLHERLITLGEQSCTVKNIPPGTYVAYFTTEDGIGYSQRIVFR